MKIKNLKNGNWIIKIAWIFLLVVSIFGTDVNINANIAELLSNTRIVFVMLAIIGEILGKYRYTKYELIFLFVLGFIWIQAFVFHTVSVAIVVTMMFLIRRIPREEFINSTILTISGVSVLVLVLFQMHILGDVVIEAGIRQLRSSLGFVWPSRLQIFCLVVACLICMKTNQKSYNKLLLLTLVVSTVIFRYTNAQYPYYLEVLLIAVCFVVHNAASCKVLNKLLGWLIKNSKKIVKYLIISLIVVTLVMFYKYDPQVEWMNALDQSLSGRLSWQLIARESRHLTFFGSLISMKQDKLYGFLDSGYLNILYGYGIIVFTLFVFFFIRSVSFAIKNKYFYDTIVLLMVAAFSMFYGQMLLNIEYAAPLLICSYYIKRYRICFNFR